MNPHLRTTIDTKLATFATAIGPSKRYWKEGKVAVQKIVDCLKQHTDNGGFNIGWMLYNGSVGKRTAIRGSDFDVLVFVNGHRPPLNECLIHFEEILKRNTHTLGIDKIKSTPHAIQFVIPRCEINVDLVPAANFLERVPDQLRQRDRIVEQHRRALAALKRERSPEASLSLYSTSLAAYQRQFIRDLGDFTAQAARLAKLWFKSLEIGKPAYGAKTLLELIIAACVMEETNGSHLSVFNRFLSKVISLESNVVKIKFTDNGGRWTLDPPKQGMREGYVIDPSNPYNDFLKGTKAKPIFLANLVRAARVTQKRLGGAPADIIIDLMFFPQYFPSGDYMNLRVQDIRDAQCGIRTVYNSRKPDMKVHKNDHKLRQPDYLMTLEVIQNFLVATVNWSAFSPENAGKPSSTILTDTMKKCQGMIASEVLKQKWIFNPTDRPFETCDVVLTVPIPKASHLTEDDDTVNIGAISLGISWKN